MKNETYLKGSIDACNGIGSCGGRRRWTRTRNNTNDFKMIIRFDTFFDTGNDSFDALRHLSAGPIRHGREDDGGEEYKGGIDELHCQSKVGWVGLGVGLFGNVGFAKSSLCVHVKCEGSWMFAA